jgi:hypothetical protein
MPHKDPSRFRSQGRLRDEEAAPRPEGLAVMVPPSGGPLGLYAARAPAAAPVHAVPSASAVADRLLVGRTREGLPEVRIDLGAGAGLLGGTEVRLLATARGLEATFACATESARRAVETQLADLARTLRQRGLAVVSCEARVRGAPTRGADPRRGNPW